MRGLRLPRYSCDRRTRMGMPSQIPPVSGPLRTSCRRQHRNLAAASRSAAALGLRFRRKAQSFSDAAASGVVAIEQSGPHRADAAARLPAPKPTIVSPIASLRSVTAQKGRTPFSASMTSRSFFVPAHRPLINSRQSYQSMTTSSTESMRLPGCHELGSNARPCATHALPSTSAAVFA